MSMHRQDYVEWLKANQRAVIIAVVVIVAIVAWRMYVR